MKKECSEIRREISQRQQESRATKEDLDNKLRNNASDEADLKELLFELEKKKVHVNKIRYI